MTLQKQVTFWVVAFLTLILVLWLLSPILLPFIAGLVLAYFLDPVADALERLGLPRLVATATILVLSILLLVFIGLLIVPILGDQIVKFAGDLPSLLQSLLARFNEVAPQWIKDAIAKSGTDIQGSISDIAGKAAGWTATLLGSIWSGGMALVNILSLLVVTPIVAFYLLADWDRLVAKVDSWLPRDHATEIRTIFTNIDAAMAGFIRGQGTVCLLLGVFYALALTIAGLKFGLVIGLAAGLLSFIPFVGALVGGLMAIGVGLVQFWPDFSSILIIIGIFAAGQFLEGNFLSPKLVGSSIGLHPVWLMFALFAFGYMFGFVGLLLAVPLAAAAGVLVRFALNQYLASKLYRGIPREMPTPVNTPVRKRVEMKGRGRQLVLDLPHRQALGRDDFLVTGSNAAAVALIDHWPDWPAHAALLVGPPGSGKTHLVEVWRQRSNAARIQAADVRAENAPELLAPGALAIEDAGSSLDEKAFFHLLNLARQQGSSVLITAQRRPELWKIALPDLLSRLRAIPVVEILPPDDALLRGVLVKLFFDRQITADESTISFMLTRMPRSLGAARLLVAEIDRRALEERAEVTRPFVAKVLSDFSAPELFGDD